MPIAAGFGVSAVAWAYGWLTAASDVRAHNARRGFDLGGVIGPLDGGRQAFGLSFAVR